MGDLATTETTFNLVPKNLNEAMQFSELIANSDLVPKDYKGKAGNVLIAIQMGSEIGLPPMQSLQNIAVINGRPCVWGDALPAIAKRSPVYEKLEETFDESTMTATCIAKRKGEKAEVRTFSQADAEKAKLWGKDGTWQTYPKRMLQMRARGFAVRDVFPDALRGLSVAEEVRDYAPEKDMGDAEIVTDNTPPSLPDYPDEQFNKNLNAWREAVEKNIKTPQDVINTISTRFSLSDEQIKTIKGLQPNKDGAAA